MIASSTTNGVRLATRCAARDRGSIASTVAVVPSEMPASWLLPALKAQATAARSYAFATRNPAADFDAYADTRSQVYGPIEHEAAASTDAVADTARRVVWY